MLEEEQQMNGAQRYSIRLHGRALLGTTVLMLCGVHAITAQEYDAAAKELAAVSRFMGDSSETFSRDGQVNLAPALGVDRDGRIVPDPYGECSRFVQRRDGRTTVICVHRASEEVWLLRVTGPKRDASGGPVDPALATTLARAWLAQRQIDLGDWTLCATRAEDAKPTGRGFRLTWGRHTQAGDQLVFLPDSIEVFVQCDSGEIVEFSRMRLPLVLTDLTPAVPQSQAEELAREFVRSPGPTFSYVDAQATELTKVGLGVCGTSKEQRLVWGVEFRGTAVQKAGSRGELGQAGGAPDEKRVAVSLLVSLDAKSGELIYCGASPSPPELKP